MSQSPNHDARRILVIDDTLSIHDDFRKILSVQGGASAGALDAAEAALFGGGGASDAAAASNEPGFDVDFASQGEEGVRMVRTAIEASRPYAVVFVDMRMPPGWDGLKTIEELWKIDSLIQTVICTAFSDHSWDDIRRRLGSSDRLLVVKKPFERIEILQLATAMSAKWKQTIIAGLKLTEMERIADERAENLRHAATHDALTGLANRSHIRAAISEAIERRSRDGAMFGAFLLDFDRFKIINDSLGHETGNALLISIAHRLRTITESWRTGEGEKATAVCGRLGGDEFMIIASGVRSEASLNDLGQQLVGALRLPHMIDGTNLFSTASVGLTSSEHEYVEPSVVMRDADVAMYRAKSSGKDRVVRFDKSMHDGMIERLGLESALRVAAVQTPFELHYQPIVEIESGRCVGAEALVRWRRDNGMLVPPGVFIDLAEETGLILPIGKWIMAQAIRDARTLMDRPDGPPDWYVGVNVSKRQMLEPGFVASVASALQEGGVPSRHLNIEVTESMIVDRPEVTIPILQQLKGLGVTLSMDDFGTGQSSLTCLQRFPLDVVKVDRGFVCNMTEHRKFSAVVNAVVSLASHLGMRVVAEGVETLEQFSQLQAMDCYAVQGWYFGKAAPVERLMETLGYVIHPALPAPALVLPARAA
ncbi:MAG: EAL domain-containing protein [Phycisphaerales bacterium]|nr:EAL domain-containing protein [Phycisphaerales bacterium]